MRFVTPKGFVVTSMVTLILGAISGFAQTPLPAPSLQNQPTPLSQAATADVSGVSGSSTAGVSVFTPVSGVGTSPSSNLGKSFGTAGSGLPGMPGGPPVNSALGAQDPSSTYMRPQTILPLLCDPAVDLPC